MNRGLARRMPLLILIGVYVGCLVILSQVVPKSSRPGAGRVTYSLSHGRPLRVIARQNPLEEKQEHFQNLILGLSVFTAILLCFTLLNVPGRGGAGGAIRAALSAAITLGIFFFFGGAQAPSWFESWRTAHWLLLRVPCPIWILLVQFIFLLDRARQPPLDAVMRPTSLLLGSASFLLFTAGLVILDCLL